MFEFIEIIIAKNGFLIKERIDKWFIFSTFYFY